MTRSATLAQWVVRLTGFVQIVLGVAFWPGRLLTLIPLHIASGLLLVVALWTMAVLAWRAGVNLGFVIVVLLWGLMLPIFGLTHDQILTGDLPYDDPDDVKVVKMHLSSPVPSPCERDASVPSILVTEGGGYKLIP